MKQLIIYIMLSIAFTAYKLEEILPLASATEQQQESPAGAQEENESECPAEEDIFAEGEYTSFLVHPVGTSYFQANVMIPVIHAIPLHEPPPNKL